MEQRYYIRYARPYESGTAYYTEAEYNVAVKDYNRVLKVGDLIGILFYDRQLQRPVAQWGNA